MISGGCHGSVRGRSVEEVKVKAIFEGIKLAVEKKWQKIVVESDADAVIKPTRYGVHMENQNDSG